ncbi:MAG: ketoacyl-ACP synthase III [Eubacteriales bacterium]|nr:ketoacyl-ACP synthase III [Eubacteriales bacterium]
MNILGIGSALPEQTVTNHQLEAFLDTSDEWIKSRTGIAQRRVMKESELTSLALSAAQKALRDAGLKGADLDMILVATTMGDYVFPSLSCLIQEGLGATCPAMDLHAACAGFIYALETADSFIKAGKAKHILVVGAEAITRLANWEDRATCVLFGDGAGAVVAGPGEGLKALRLTARTDRNALYMLAEPGNNPFTGKPEEAPEGVKMQGQDVFRFAVTQSIEDLGWVADQVGVAVQEMDWVLLHQANRRILDAVRLRLKLDPKKVPGNIHRTGNTSAASIPLLLDELYRAGLLEPGQLIAMSAFGAGLVSGACVLKWGKEPPEELTAAEDLFSPPVNIMPEV